MMLGIRNWDEGTSGLDAYRGDSKADHPIIEVLGVVGLGSHGCVAGCTSLPICVKQECRILVLKIELRG